ncbi:MAG: type II secretion system F family protein [Firmicutes bacterium]|nr:type II secretion system F family protein [Bacillota bacterium]
MKQEKLNNLQIADLCREISLMIHAGVGLGDGLSLLAEDSPSDTKKLLRDLASQVDGGMTLAAALTAVGRFPLYVTAMVEVAETTGHLEETLLSLSNYYEERDHMDRQVRNTLMYPSILSLLMMIIIVVLLTKVLPMFETAYASLGASLTGLAGGLLLLGQILNSILPLLCVLLGVAAVALMAFLSSGAVRDRALGVWYRFRGDRGVVRKIHDSRFAQALALGLRCGLPVEQAVEQAAELLKEVPAAWEKGQVCAEEVRSGADLAETLRKGQLLPASACRRLALGMKGGNGDAVMEEISRRLAEEAQEDLERKVGRIEPAMVLTTALLVGMILLVVMLPLMDIMSVIG